jgi:Uncharacterized protein conserved in bacteria
MIGRIAESLYWLGRYLERIENHTRLIDVDYHMQTLHEDRDQYPWKELMDTIGTGGNPPDKNMKYTESGVLDSIIFDKDNVNSILSCVIAARTNAQTVRERLPSEMWDAINGFYIWLNNRKLHDLLVYPHTFFEQIKNQTALFQGIAYSTMLRGPEWNMLQAGKYLERSENTLRIFRVVYSDSHQDMAYDDAIALLKSVSGYEAFRKCLSNKVTIENMLGFLILNDIFPRSTRYSLGHLKDHLSCLYVSHGSVLPEFSHVMQLIGRFYFQLAYMDSAEISRTGVIPFLEKEIRRCNTIGSEIGKMFSTKGVNVLSF